MTDIIEKLQQLTKPEDSFIDAEFNTTLRDLIRSVDSYGSKFVFNDLLPKQKRQQLSRASCPIETLKIDARFKAEAKVFAYLAEEIKNA